MLDQILMNPAWRITAYVVIFAISYAATLAVYHIGRAELRSRAQRRADRIAEEMNVARNLRGMK